MSNARNILKRRRTVEVPLDSGLVFVRVLSLGELANLKGRFKKFAEDKDYQAVIAVVHETVCEEDGTAIFAAEEVDQVAAIDHDQLLKVFAAAVELNGLGEGKASRPRTDSNTASPSPSAGPLNNSGENSMPVNSPAGGTTSKRSRGARPPKTNVSPSSLPESSALPA